MLLREQWWDFPIYVSHTAEADSCLQVWVLFGLSLAHQYAHFLYLNAPDKLIYSFLLPQCTAQPQFVLHRMDQYAHFIFVIDQ